MNRTELTDFLLRTSSYPHHPKSVVHIQTHASDVFIVSPYVYKVKKPVDFGFLDFTALEKRKYFLDKELVLNRRLTNGIYLEVLKISLKDGEYVFGPGEKIVEYALLMKELPVEYFLKRLLTEGKASKKDFDSIAQKLAGFYKSESQNSGVSVYGEPESIKESVDESTSLSRKFIGDTISGPAFEGVEYYNRSFFETRSHLFRERVEGGFIKDCHGDLHLEHINISPQGINIYDCIEFNERFRFIDIASDTGFLAMDLDYNGYYDYSRYFISRISETMGDARLYRVLDFYKCYRAYVRGKVESIKAFEPEVPGDMRHNALERAKEYFKLALRYALFGSRPTLLVICGSIGTGKSTLAAALSNELSCRVISSDVLRKDKTGTEPGQRHYEEYEGGIYSKEITRDVYKELADRGTRTIEEGECAVLDASFSKLKWRELIRCSASKHNLPVIFIQTTAPMKIVRERLRKRELLGESVSDGRLEILERFTKEYEEPFEVDENRLITVDTTGPRDIELTKLLKRLVELNMETVRE